MGALQEVITEDKVHSRDWLNNSNLIQDTDSARTRVIA